mmetsp:Transcript_12634/g.11182  ORF Transcript_12634/g.11182 Transcript_12634/m.11182 type:complete len:223 (+) Transcript_12634:92-760(+)
MCKQDFKTGRGSTWSKTVTNCNEKIYDPYIDRFDAIGDTIIKRKKEKEVSRKAFTSTIKRDPLSEDQLFTTKSIRSFKSVQGFTSFNPGLLRSRSVISEFGGIKASLSKERSIPFYIKVNEGDTESAKTQSKKANQADLQHSSKGELFNKLKSNHSRGNPLGMRVTKHSLFSGRKEKLQDKQILSQLAKSKMYYKSAQGRMINPETYKGKHTARRHSMEAIG